MNDEKHPTPSPCNPYDAIEDAIDLSKKDPTRTWDDLLRRTPTRHSGDEPDCGKKGKVAATSHKFLSDI